MELISNNIALLLVLPVALFLLSFIVSFIKNKYLLKEVKLINNLAVYSGFITAILAGILYFTSSLQQATLFQVADLGFGFRVDTVSLIMFSMIAIIGFVIIRYSNRYLAGDPRQHIFLGRLALTLASVQVLVLAGDLITLCVAWVATSLALHQLLVYYKHRPRAISAARKKFIVARLGDVFVITAALLLYFGYSSTNLEVIFTAIQAGALQNIEIVAACLALAAIFKSAQFPMFSWLLEVMETPTPVSALLHAGLLNAGPFLIIRMAYVMDAATYAPILLIIIGGFTAICGSIIYMTQSSIKTALAYSSISHMGFSLLSCGLGIFPAAMLHLVAHSFYKAHAFLSSGSLIEWFRAHKNEKLQQSYKYANIALGIGATLVTYFVSAYLWGFHSMDQFGLLLLGGIIAIGASKLLINVIDAKNNGQLMAQAIGLVLLVAFSFFTLESISSGILIGDVPLKGAYNLAEIVVGLTFVALFLSVMFIQNTSAMKFYSKSFHKMLVVFKNGLYVNAYFDQVIRALHIKEEPFDYSDYHIKARLKKQALTKQAQKPLTVEA